jgi:hypothetical protein
MRIRYFCLVILPALLPAGEAVAITKALKEACRNDYRANCSAFEVGSSELKSCMRAVQHKLSSACAKEIARSGEATKEEIENYKKRHKP